LDFRFWIESRENKPMNALPSKSLSDNREPVPSTYSGRALSHAEGSAIRNRKSLGLLVITFALVACAAMAWAQQPANVPRIGFQADAPAATIAARIEAFRQGLRELGYIEAKNILIEWRSAEGKPERRSEIAADFVRRNMDVIVSAGPAVTRVLREATSTIPIVMLQDTDPVGSGVVASLARPGGNITGLAALSPEMSGKQLELLKQIVPKLSRVAVIGNSTVPGDAQGLRETVLAAGSFEIYLRYLDVVSPKDIETVLRAAAKGRADALVFLGNPILNTHRQQVAELAAKHRLPATYGRPEFVEAGGLIYFGTSYNDLARRAATYVDKILKGAKPADLPVEQPTKFELIINLKAAKQIGLTIPPTVLARADKVIR
jgi:putative tryptophan/tyrosine transport system substrate-binding protein